MILVFFLGRYAGLSDIVSLQNFFPSSDPVSLSPNRVSCTVILTS